ncbi:MAG: hypothetical protein HQK65_19340 [Desulfamplus sp.]|nr:hypothetical protein [Desulfamplus sp.]
MENAKPDHNPIAQKSFFMHFIIETPDTRAPERDYILSVILCEFLGLEWQRLPSDRKDIRITLQGHQGEILLPDILFQTPDAAWLTPESLPPRPLSVWETRNAAIDCPLVHSHLPVIYGDLDFPEKFKSVEKKSMALPLDIFGSAFFMLTRYEEVVKPERDEHNRFPAWASLAFQENFLDRPIINEYLEILWFYIQALVQLNGLTEPVPNCCTCPHSVSKDQQSRETQKPMEV